MARAAKPGELPMDTLTLTLAPAYATGIGL